MIPARLQSYWLFFETTLLPKLKGMTFRLELGQGVPRSEFVSAWPT